MRKYTIPPTITEKEKVIGGVLTMIEFMYIIAGIIIGIGVFIVTFKANKILACMLGLIFGMSGIPFAFIKPRGYTIFQYFKYKKRFKKKEKKLPNKRSI